MLPKTKLVYTVRHGLKVWTYASAAAMLADFNNPLTLARDRLRYLAKKGWPVDSDDCQIWRGPLLRHQSGPQ